MLCNDQNGPKVSRNVALVKFGHMLENPVNPWVLVAQAAVTNLKVRKISRTPSRNPKSPMRFTQKALFPAFVADCFRKKNPISR